MFINELLEYFDSLNLTALSRDEYKQWAFKVHDMYKQIMPGIPENFEDLRSIEPIPELTDRIIEHWSQDKKTDNPLRKDVNNQVAQHSFFKDRTYVCAAPYTSLRFDVNGKMTVCCSNTDYPIGTYPETTPLQAWQGEAMRTLRESLDRYDFSKGCQQCAKFILTGNAHNTVLVAHDKIIPDVQKHMKGEWPAHMVFQNHNTCNYECIMCGGQYSSLIARNRDHKTYPNPYNTDEFLKHIEPFIEHVAVFEFLGGEPFLIAQNYKIWDMIKQKNPNAIVNMISNGSIFNAKVEQALMDLPNSLVHISIDAVTPDIYAYIRRNGNIENVKMNIRRLKEMKKLGSLSVCPMIQNIRDIPNVIAFCEEVGVDIWFNDVQTSLGIMWSDKHENGCINREGPADASQELIKEFRLWKLPAQELQDHVNFLKSVKVSDRYQARLQSFINYVQNYVQSLSV